MITIKRVGVVGSGTMGAGIVEVAARAGFEVVIRSRSQAGADACLRTLEASLRRQVEKNALAPDDCDGALGRVSAFSSLDELELCDLVIESVVEDIDTKVEVFRQLDRICTHETVLATNTSTLPVVELAMATDRPDRVCGLHFFNPAPRMPLVEVVPALTTSQETVAAAWRFALDCGKSPVAARDEAGFVVNALLFPYLNGAVRMLDAGVASKEDIDTAMRGGCGFPMGPFELLDLVGLDTSLAVLQALDRERPGTECAPAPLLRRLVTAGRLGRKTGTGFHTYPASPNATPTTTS